MAAVEADAAQIGYGAGALAVPAGRVAKRSRPSAHWQAIEAAGLVTLAGGALLVTFVLLGRPPLSLPTLAGLRTFLDVAALGLVFCLAETFVLARTAGRSLSDARRLSLAGCLPLGVGWLLVALLYRADVHHWFVTVASVKPSLLLAVLLPAAAVKVAVLAIVARATLQAWCWRWRYPLAGLAYGGAALCAKPSLWHIDLPMWFVPAAELVLRGDVLAVYGVRADFMGAPSPIEHGPLTILLYAPFVALAQLAGKTDFLRVGAMFPLLGILAADCLLAYVATRAVRDLAPRADERRLFGVYALILFSPLLWFSSVWLVHLESLSALLLICAVRLLSRGSASGAGACLGAALLLKHSAALAAGPLLLAFFIGGRYAHAIRAGAVAAAIAVGGLAPFAVAAPDDFTYNFFGYDAIKPLYGLTLWKAAYDSGIEPVIMRFDSALVALVTLAGAAGLSLHMRRRGADVRLTGWVAIALGQMAWLALATWQHPHYFVLCFAALLIWETAVRPGWPVGTLLVLFIPYNLQSHFPSNVGQAGGAFVVARAAAQTLFLYGCAVALWMRAVTTPSGESSPSAASAAGSDLERGVDDYRHA